MILLCDGCSGASEQERLELSTKTLFKRLYASSHVRKSKEIMDEDYVLGLLLLLLMMMMMILSPAFSR
ncbi:hypothetical protein HanXRQr2_Chr04g0160491 [Helianthus annuus]|uniref:Uncharacterized protein n=1 Tax=Helianthus annuus TaxID=4232 RepID=A0A251RSL3_HELAN|nr:hypothetical protein HanXRQr2_Chr04g0160491 [Helianthus annuus]KAJ0930871.1 hypothetical protein HanPSC8_Chr04g0154571 [Helianthus annuus]